MSSEFKYMLKDNIPKTHITDHSTVVIFRVNYLLCDVICINYLDMFTYFWTLRVGKSVNTHTVFLVYTKLAFIPKTREITVPAWGKVELTSETSF